MRAYPTQRIQKEEDFAAGVRKRGSRVKKISKNRKEKKKKT